MSLARFPRSEALVADMRAEFPSFAIVPKRGDRLQHAIDRLLRIVTLGGQDRYLTHYHTVLFGKLWVPDGWDAMGDRDRYVLLRHERVHLRQRERYGDVLMALLYLLPFFPLGLAYGRARIEWEAYEETLRATLECAGSARAWQLEDELVQRFVGPDYGWMWPFPRAVRGWFRDAMQRIEAEHARRDEAPPQT